MPAIDKESRFLIVDDSIIMRNMLRSVMSSFGYDALEEAENGKVALDKMQKAQNAGAPIDVVFLDWAMPEMDGLAFLKICREKTETKNIPIVMITAVSEQSHMIEAIKNGATAYITKPFAPEKVFEAIKYASAWAEKSGQS